MKEKIPKLLKSNKAFADNCIAMSVAVIGILMVILLGFAGYSGIHQYSQLNVFADEMSQAVANAGRTNGVYVSKRYEELSKNTGYSPTINYSANYYNNAQKTVQYGDSIELIMTANIEMKTFMDLTATIPVTIKKTSQSQQCWK